MRWVGKVGSDSSAFDSNARSRIHVDRYLVYDKLHQDSGIRIDISSELYIYFLLRINCTSPDEDGSGSALAYSHAKHFTVWSCLGESRI